MTVRDLGSLIRQMEQDQSLDRVARNPLAQFGPEARPYLGASILPEIEVPENAFREEQIKYRSVIANHGTRYSPVQLKGSAMSGWVDVVLANSDIGASLTSRDYDVLLRYLRSQSDMEAIASLIRFADTMLNNPLVERNEKDRWDAIVNAAVVLTGDNGYTETISYSDPAGHRASAGGTWSNDAYDPMADIYAMAQLFYSKGLRLNRLITSRNVVSILMLNAKIATRTNKVTVDGSGQILANTGRVTIAEINAALAQDDLPALELYDALYRTQSGTGRFLPNDVVVGIAATGRDVELDLGDRLFILGHTLGYTGVGRAAGQSNPGRTLIMTPYRDKPPRIDGQAWQASLPVITEPEGVFVIKDIS
jgi:hypothetical protein